MAKTKHEFIKRLNDCIQAHGAKDVQLKELLEEMWDCGAIDKAFFVGVVTMSCSAYFEKGLIIWEQATLTNKGETE